MENKDQVPYEDDDMDSLDDYDDDSILDDSSEDSDEPEEVFDAKAQARINARHAIERRNELKALQSELEDWDHDDLLDDD